MTGFELLRLARGLGQAGYRVRTFRYPSVRSNLADNARRLARFHERVTVETGKAHLVGHSLGGLVIAQMLHHYPDQIARVGRVIALGTPFLGSLSAKVLAGLPFGTNLLGQCFPETVEATRLPQTLPCESWDLPLDLGIIAGTYPLGAGRLFKVFTGPNDGVIAVEETQLPGATAHLTVNMNHGGLMFSGEVIRQTAHFLTRGRFGPVETAGGAAANQPDQVAQPA